MKPETLPELKPCPFCGSSPELDHLSEPDDFFVSCPKCEIQQIANYSPIEAVRRWNERHEILAKNWEEEARRFCKGEKFYRDLITRIGQRFGVEVHTSDDGSVQQDVLALKVPELVDELMDALCMMYDKWENGIPCTDGGEEDGCPLGNAFKLSEAEESRVLKLIPKYPGVTNEPTTSA